MNLDFSYRPNENLPSAAHQQVREAGPVIWSDTLNGWIVSAYDECRSALADVTRFTNKGTPVETQLGPEGMLTDDTPLHNFVRAIWVDSSSRATLVARKEELEANAADVLEPLRPRLEAGEVIDLIPIFQQFAIAFISSSFAVAPERLVVFERWAQRAADAPATELAEGSDAQASHQAIRAELHDLIRLEIEDRRARIAKGETPADFIGQMVSLEGQNGVTSAMVADNIFNFIIGPLDTTEKWIGNSVVRLCTNPELRREILADRSQLEPFINESMRTDTVAQIIMRRVKVPETQLGGQTLKEGDQLYMLLGAANRDPAKFDNAESFDFRRPAQQALGFGFGFHHCLGINIAKQETLALLNVLLDTYPDLRVEECDYGNTWALWGPRKLNVSLTKKN